MSFNYPVVLDLCGKPCLVIGNSWAAEEKIHGLLEAGASVTLLSPDASTLLRELSQQGRITWKQQEYSEGMLAGYFLVIAAMSDRLLNQHIWTEAESRSILFNAVDEPEHCRFIFPAIHRQGDLVVAVSTNGKTPALAVRIRDRLASELGPEYARLLQIFGELRRQIASRFRDFESRKGIWYRLVDSDVLALLRAGDEEGARRALTSILDNSSR